MQSVQESWIPPFVRNDYLLAVRTTGLRSHQLPKFSWKWNAGKRSLTVAEDHADSQFVNIGPEEFRPALSVAEDSSACAPAVCQTSDVRLETEVSELFSSPSSSPTPPPPVLPSPCSPLSHPTSPLSSHASSHPEVVDSIEERWPDLLASDDEVDAPVAGEAVFAAQQPPAGSLFVADAINGHLCPLLVDTGSAVTLMSEWFATVEMGLDPDSFTVDSPHLALSGPSGEQLTVVGSFIAHLVIGAAECRHRVPHWETNRDTWKFGGDRKERSTTDSPRCTHTDNEGEDDKECLFDFSKECSTFRNGGQQLHLHGNPTKDK